MSFTPNLFTQVRMIKWQLTGQYYRRLPITIKRLFRFVKVEVHWLIHSSRGPTELFMAFVSRNAPPLSLNASWKSGRGKWMIFIIPSCFHPIRFSAVCHSPDASRVCQPVLFCRHKLVLLFYDLSYTGRAVLEISIS